MNGQGPEWRSRYVLGVAEIVPLDDDGFLDPGASNRWWSTVAGTPTQAVELVGDAGSFVLLAPPYAGKSTVMAGMSAVEPGAVVVDALTGDLDSLLEQLRGAVRDGGPVYVDALDEAALSIPGVVGAIAREMTQSAARSVRWRLACRPYIWNPGIAETLGRALPAFRQLKLLPLDRASAAQLAAGCGADPEEYLQAISDARLGRLAATPRRLRLVAEQWVEARTLPTDASGAISYEIDALLREPDALRARQPSLSRDRRMRLAERLGLFAIFGAGTSFATAASDRSDVVEVDELPSDPEPEDLGSPFSNHDYEAVLGSGLFHPAPGGSLDFAHRQFAEYLAARYIIERRASSRTVRSLLAVHENGYLPREFIGVAAWLTAFAPDLTGDIIRLNAVELARSGVELPSSRVRTELVDAILARATEGDIDAEYGLDFGSLAHAGLCQQLERAHAEGLRTPVQLWWVARLAGAAGCHESAQALLNQALDSRWPDWARSAAVRAVRELGDENQTGALAPLLRLPIDEDPGDVLLAAVAEALYPDLLTTEDLLDALRPRRNDHLIGEYYVFLREIGDRIPNDDVLAALRWLQSHLAGEWDDFEPLPQRLVDRAWRLADTPRVRDALATLLAQAARNHTFRWRLFDGEPPWVGDSERRRPLAVAVAVELASETGWFDLFDLRLVGPDDLDWLIDDLPALPREAQAPLAHCIPQFARDLSYDHAMRIHELDPDHPAYAATEHLRGTVGLDSDVARRGREFARTPRIPEAPDPEEVLAQLDDAMSETEHDAEHWWRLLWALTTEPDDHFGERFTDHDFTRRTRWALLSEPQQQRVLVAGLEYLALHRLQPAQWRGLREIQPGLAYPDWAGVYLLTTLAAHWPETVRALDEGVLRRFAPAIVGAWNFDRDGDGSLRADLVRMAPASAVVVLADEALEQIDLLAGDDVSLPCRDVYRALMGEIKGSVAERLVGDAIPGFAGSWLLEDLVDADPQLGLDTCQRIRESLTHRLHGHAAMYLAKLDAEATIDGLLASGAEQDGLIAYVPHIDLTSLDTGRLVDLLGLLLDAFPFNADPPRPRGASSPDGAHRTREMRGHMLVELARRGGVAGLSGLALGRSEQDRSVILWYVRDARARAADIGVTRLAPRALIDLLARTDARLVQGDEDLQLVVEETVAAVAHDIARQNAFRDLWHERGGGRLDPKSEDDISDWLQRQLQPRLSASSIVDREVQVARRGRGGIGPKFDVGVTSAVATRAPAIARVIVEAKRLDHPEVMTALRSQLANLYLAASGHRHGIYLVYWVRPEQRPAGWPSRLEDPVEFLAELQAQATTLADTYSIRPLLLDISRPRPEPVRTRPQPAPTPAPR